MSDTVCFKRSLLAANLYHGRIRVELDIGLHAARCACTKSINNLTPAENPSSVNRNLAH